ncbi:hypothetical protein F4859DRAFT_486786 [Xylaria cf. heliscus]|nr:hypothetical protein F4859DRAFT_486786 [Xylaria cf. heliscus]
MPGLFYAPTPPIRHYFAYGNNLSLKRMAESCPSSMYIGRAVLPNHYWYINQIGVANIMPRRGSTVHGLVYTLTADDERHLDRIEHVHNGRYSKTYKRVDLYPAPYALQMRTRYMVEDGGPRRVIQTAKHLSVPIAESPGCDVDVLVYQSNDFVLDGQAPDRYIEEMNSGIRNAISLGVSPNYFKNTVRRWIPTTRQILYNADRQWNEYPLTNFYAPPFPIAYPFGHEDYQRPDNESRYRKATLDRKYQEPRVSIKYAMLNFGGAGAVSY